MKKLLLVFALFECILLSIMICVNASSNTDGDVSADVYDFVSHFLEATAREEWQCEDIDLKEMMYENGEKQHLDFFVDRNRFFKDVRSPNDRINFSFDCSITDCTQEGDKIYVSAVSSVTFLYEHGNGYDTHIEDEFNITLVKVDGAYKVFDIDRLWDWFNKYRDTGFDYDELYNQWVGSNSQTSERDSESANETKPWHEEAPSTDLTGHGVAEEVDTEFNLPSSSFPIWPVLFIGALAVGFAIIILLRLFFFVD